MNEDRADPSLLIHANAASQSMPQSIYARLSLFVSAIATAWFMLSMRGTAWMPFDLYKQHRITWGAAALAVILAIAAYRQPMRRRDLALVAMIVSVHVLLLALLIVPV